MLNTSSETQHFKSKEYIKKLLIKNDHDQENVNSLYVSDQQRQYDPSKKLGQIWLSSFNRRDVNQGISNKEADELNNTHKNLKTDKDNLDSKFAINKKTGFIRDDETERNTENKEFASSNNRKKDIINSETKDAEEIVKIKKSDDVELPKHEETNKSYNSNDKIENNLNIKMSNNNEPVEYVEKNIDNDPKAKELGKENTQTWRDIGKQTDAYTKQLQYYQLGSEDVKNILDRIHLNENALKKILDKQPIAIVLLAKINRSSSAGLFRKSKNYLVSSRRDFKNNEENEQERESNYIALIPIEIKNIYEMSDAKNIDDSLESCEIPARWDDQYILGKMPGWTNKYIDETSEEFEYEDLSTSQSENNENKSISDEEISSKNKQDISVEDSETESETGEQYKITSDELDNKRGIFLLLPWKNVKERQRRQIKNEINEGTAKIKREITRQSQPNKFNLAEDLENIRTKRYYLNNIINKEEEKNMIETSDINVNYLEPRINKKNHDDLLNDFIKARKLHKKNNLNNNEASFTQNEEKSEIIPLNNVSKSNKKLLQETVPKLQNYMEPEEEFVNDSEENFNGTLTTDGDEHHKNRTSETTGGNVFYTAIMNIKDFFAFFSKISQMFIPKF